MRLIDLSYIVNTIKMDEGFPLRPTMTIEFILPKKEYARLLAEVNTLIYKDSDVDNVELFEVLINGVKFRIISE